MWTWEWFIANSVFKDFVLDREMIKTPYSLLELQIEPQDEFWFLIPQMYVLIDIKTSNKTLEKCNISVNLWLEYKLCNVTISVSADFSQGDQFVQ